MSFTKVAPAGIGTSPGTSILIGDSLLHSTGIDIGSNTGVGVTIRQHGDATFTGIVTAASFSGSGANLTGIDATAIKHTDGNVKVQAINTGANLTGNLSVSGNLGVGGVLTYEDVTNIDSVGVITARGGIKIGPTAGVAGTFFADGSYVTAGVVTATTFYGSGANLTGITQVGGATGADFNDNVKLRFGTGNDLEVFHDASHSRIHNNTGLLLLECDGTGIEINSGASTENMAKFLKDGAVELYHDNTKKLATHDDGVVLNGLDQSTVAHNQYDNLVLGSTSGSSGLTIASGSSSPGTIAWSDSSGSSGNAQYRAYIEYYHNNHWMDLAVDAGVSFRFGGSSNVSYRHFIPSSDNSLDLGSSSARWRNLYTTDLQLSNEGKTNDVDGTWGNYTIQEGENDLFLINNRNGKKYKFNLTEVS